MKSPFRFVLLIVVTVALAFVCGCGGGGGSTTPPPPPPPPPPPSLAIVTTKIPNGVVGKAYSTTLQATGGTGTRIWSMTYAPAWLSLNTSTGELAGTSTENWYGWVDFQVKDTANQTMTAQLLLAVYPVLEIVAPAGGTLGLDYSGVISAQGGSWPIKQLSITGSLPPGLTAQLDNYNNGYITGTPSQAGSFTFTVEAADSAEPPQTVKSDVTMVIDTHLAITTKQLKYGVEGRPYSDTPMVINGTPPYTWSAQWIPPGLSINATTGEISGTPTASSSTTSLTVTDSSSPAQTATRGVPLTVYGKLASYQSNPVFTSTAGWVSNPVSVYGGVPPLTYAVTSGQLPAGISLDGKSGYLSGTVQQGFYEFSIATQDSASPPQVLERPFAMRILPPSMWVNWVNTLLVRAGKPLSYQFTATGGTPPFKWQVIGSLPAGVTLSDAGLLSGTPSEEGYFKFTARASDSADPVQKATTTAELRVLPFAPVPNNSIANATPLGSEGLSASISPYTDENGVAAPDTDYFQFLAQGGSTVTARTNVDYGSYVDTVLELLDQSGTRLKTCNNPADDNPPSWIVSDPTPYGFDDDCVNDDAGGGLSSALDIKVPGNSDTIQTLYAHVVDYRGDARPDMGYSMSVWPFLEPLHLRDTAMPAVAVGHYYYWAPDYTGGLGTNTFGMGAGSTLPPGLSIVGNQISGIPTTPGQYALTLQRKDSANPPEVAERTYQFTIVPTLTIDLTSLPDATVGVPYDAPVATSGGGQDLKFLLSPSSWPCCLYVREDGHIVGTPKEAGTYNAWVGVGDETGQSASKFLTLTVTDSVLQMKTFSLPAAKAGSSYSAVLNANGGTQPYTWRVTSGSLPPGVTLDGGELRGMPTQPGTYPFTVEAREPGTKGQVANIGLSISVR